jgi:cytochrome c2
MVFMKNCATCHSLEAVDVRDMKGPSLGLIYNRRVGANTNYVSYSDKMLKSTFFWSAKNLFRFMANPNSLVPDTACWLRKHPIYSE